MKLFNDLKWRGLVQDISDDSLIEKLNEENINYAWVSYEEAKGYDLVEGLIKEIEMVNRILKNKKEKNDIDTLNLS